MAHRRLRNIAVVSDSAEFRLVRMRGIVDDPLPHPVIAHEPVTVSRIMGEHVGRQLEETWRQLGLWV